MSENKPEEYKPLCYRCDWRAKYLEDGIAPRSECQSATSAVFGCYMFKNTMPLVTKPRDNDNRPMFAGMVGCRMKGVRIAEEMEYRGEVTKDGEYITYWEMPKEAENAN